MCVDYVEVLEEVNDGIRIEVFYYVFVEVSVDEFCNVVCVVEVLVIYDFC